MSVSAFAKEIVELDDGIIMTVYAPGEIVEVRFISTTKCNIR